MFWFSPLEQESGFSAVSSSAADFSKPATDISHLVRKRVSASVCVCAIYISVFMHYRW